MKFTANAQLQRTKKCTNPMSAQFKSSRMVKMRKNNENIVCNVLSTYTTGRAVLFMADSWKGWQAKEVKDRCTRKPSKGLKIQNPQQQRDSECVTSPIEPSDRKKSYFLVCTSLWKVCFWNWILSSRVVDSAGWTRKQAADPGWIFIFIFINNKFMSVTRLWFQLACLQLFPFFADY